MIISARHQDNAAYAMKAKWKPLKTDISKVKKLSKSIACFCLVSLLPAHAVNAATYLFHNDHLGTPQVLTDATQQVVWQSEQDPFGEVTEVTNQVEQNLRFPGQYLDMETGLHYNYFRTYDTSLGRYLSSDPIGLQGGINSYTYVQNMPNTATDPYGLYCYTKDGMITCRHPGGPQFTLPAPKGANYSFTSRSPLYHQYDVSRSIGCANPSDVFSGFVGSPTPGNPSSATPGGTRNNAEVFGQSNWVTSYTTTDLATGAPLVVNLADPNSLFYPGYVAHAVKDGFAHSYGEGTDWKQGSLFPSYDWITHMGNESVWGGNMDSIISECSCQ